jgi:hypothetical protein
MDISQQADPDIREPRATAIKIADALVGTSWPQSAPRLDFVPDDTLSKDLQKVVKLSEDFATFDVAAIDFSGSRPLVGLAAGALAPKPPKHLATTFIASMAKLAVLYAAFQMRQDLQTVIKKDKDATKDGKGSYWQLGAGARVAKLKTDLQAYWVQNSKHLGQPENRAKPHGAKIGERSDIGRLERMFDLSELGNGPPDPNKIDFVGMRRCGLSRGFAFTSVTQALMHNLDDLRQHEDEHATAVKIWKLDFAERLWMMTAWSSNVAASACICDVGFAYIQALMHDSGLFTDGGEGLYLTVTFRPTPRELVNDLGRPVSRFPAPGSQQRGNVKSLVALMIALQQNVLISASASEAMKQLLRPVPYAALDRPLATPGDIRLLEGMDRGPDESASRHPSDAFTKGGSNGERHVPKSTQGSAPKKPVAIGTACDWDYIEIGSHKVGLIVLNSSVVKPIPPSSPSDAHIEAEANVLFFAKKLTTTMPAFLPP